MNMEREPNKDINSGKEFLPFREKKKKTSAGVAVLIVGLDPSRNGNNELDPLIWTITELKNKPETNKLAGQISSPAETRKNGENIEDNVLGALAEFCNDTTFPNYVKNHLVRVGRWIGEKGVFVGESPVDVAVLIYDGALDFPFKPSCPDEVSANGWVKKSDLISNPNVRDVLRQALDFDTEQGLTRNALENYHKNPQGRKLVVPENVSSIEEFSNIREYGTDTRVMGSDELEVFKKLPDAKKIIQGAMGLLSEAQKLEKRDYSNEEAITLFLKKELKKMEKGLYAVGINEVEGLDMRTITEMPKSWWDKKDGKEKEFYGKYFQECANVGKLSSTEDSVKKGWGGGWSLQRGDRLGYPEELGKSWYLIFWEKQSNVDRVKNFVVAPLSGIKSFKLKSYDEYGM
jgi:hypothetical protein